MNNAVIIPSLEPNDKLLTLVDDLFNIGFQSIVVVDDGSGSQYRDIFSKLKSRGCIVLHHNDNKGKGMAIKKAILELKNNYPQVDGYITADSDGQHTPQDIKKVSDCLWNYQNSIVLGVRNFSTKHIPLKSRFGNGFSSIFYKVATGVTCKDTQTGLRGFSSDFANFALSIEGSRYEYEMNFLLEAGKIGIPLKMIPIKTIYEDNNKCSHFKPISDSIRIYRTPLRFALSSLICAVADLGIFTLITNLLSVNIYAVVGVSTVVARIFSGMLNFILNRKWSFFTNQTKSLDWKPQAIKYFILFIAQMSISSLSVSLLSFIPIHLTIIKVIVDSVLFLFSYYVQHNWVFKNTKGIINTKKKYS